MISILFFFLANHVAVLIHEMGHYVCLYLFGHQSIIKVYWPIPFDVRCYQYYIKSDVKSWFYPRGKTKYNSHVSTVSQNVICCLAGPIAEFSYIVWLYYYFEAYFTPLTYIIVTHYIILNIVTNLLPLHPNHDIYKIQKLFMSAPQLYSIRIEFFVMYSLVTSCILHSESCYQIYQALSKIYDHCLIIK